MSWIKDWAFSICVTLIVIGLFSMFVPKGNMEKVVKFTVSLFFLSCIISPFIFSPPKLSLDTSSISVSLQDLEEYDIVKTKNEQFSNYINSALKGLIKNKLNEIDVIPKKIDININISETNSISISTIDILLNKSYEIVDNQISAMIKKEVGVDPSLIYE